MHVVVLGAGLAGLAAAHDLARGGARVTLLEKERRVGGMASSWKVGQHWLDHGPHRFHSRDPELVAHLHEVLDGEVVVRQRQSRIHLLGRMFDYPLKLSNVLGNLPPSVLVRSLWDYFVARVSERISPTPDAHFQAWVEKRFGRTLYELFFGTYTEKAWRMPCDQISADWASQRISQANLVDVIAKTLRPPQDGEVRSLVNEFWYPAQGGIGQIARSYAARIAAAGGELRLDTPVQRIELDGRRAVRVVGSCDGQEESFECDHVLSTMPWSGLLRAIEFPEGAGLSPEAREALEGLRTIGIVFVYLEVERPRVMPDHWVYLPDPELTVHRVSEFKNFSDASSPGDRTVLCCEITCRPGDERWDLDLERASQLARADLVRAGLLEEGQGRGIELTRLEHAYPVYDLEYRGRIQTLRRETRRFDNITSTGRQGLFRYNNMDHSMAMGRKAARNLLAEGASCGERSHESIAAGAEYFG